MKEAVAAAAQATAAVSVSVAEAPAEALQTAIVELEQLNRDTENEFLRLGGQISGFIELVNLISADLAGLGELVSGHQGQPVTEALTGVLQQSTEMKTRNESGGRLLESLREEAHRLKIELGRFSHTNAAFHSLGLLTRIETARLGNSGADFGNLAEEVKLLARNVQIRTESALTIAADLVPRIEEALRDVAILQESQTKDLPVVIAQVTGSLSSFRQMQAEAREASVQLSAAYQEISNTFKRLLISMQFNDITRQQVEHVADALKRLIHEKDESRGALLLECAGANGVLQLQSSQLANADQVFGRSVASVAQSLEEMAGQVAHMVERGGALSGMSGKHPALHRMEAGCNAILGSLKRGADGDAATSDTSESLTLKIDEMRAAIEEVRTIETQMRRIAMNTRISAEHLGSSGEALGALADLIKQRAFESRESSDSLVENLASMNQVLIRFAAHARQPDSNEFNNGDERVSGESVVREALTAAIAGLHAGQERSGRQIRLITDRADGLCQGIRAASEDFKLAVRFSQVVNRTRERLELLIEEAGGPASSENAESAARLLASFTQNYTMREERDIFAATGQESDPHSSIASEAQSIGDDIEFF